MKIIVSTLLFLQIILSPCYLSCNPLFQEIDKLKLPSTIMKIEFSEEIYKYILSIDGTISLYIEIKDKL